MAFINMFLSSLRSHLQVFKLSIEPPNLPPPKVRWIRIFSNSPPCQSFSQQVLLPYFLPSALHCCLLLSCIIAPPLNLPLLHRLIQAFDQRLLLLSFLPLSLLNV